MKPLMLAFPLAAFIALSTLSGNLPAAHAGEHTIIAVGDMLPRASWQPFQIPVQKLYEGVVSMLFEADMVIGNLECPLTGRVEPTASKSEDSLKDKRNFVFKAEDEGTAQGLRDSGFTVLTLANNHILDFREEGLLDTLKSLEKAGILTAGAGRDVREANAPCVTGKPGSEVVVLAASDVVPKGFGADAGKPGIASMKDANAFIERVRKERQNYPDALIVLSLHWGTEASYIPTTRQMELAHALVDAGADLILGHHPHRIQGVEFYKDRPVFYSLGNFQFDTNKPGDETFIAKLVYEDGSHVPMRVTVSPVLINEGGAPVILEPGSPEYKAITDRLDTLSRDFGVELAGEDLVPAKPEEGGGYDYWGT